MSRNLDREMAFKYMYSLLFEKIEDSKTEKLIFEDVPQTEAPQDESGCFFAEFCSMAKDNLAYLEGKLAQNLNKSVPKSSVYAIDKAIIFSAMVEIDFMKEDAPLVITESVRIAKKYSTDNSPKFINGILSSIYTKNVGENNA